jgi:uncharacterized cupin superfamily protein
MPKVDLEAIEPTNRTGYPPPFDEPVAGRWQRPIGDKFGFKSLGARYAVLEPGAWSSQRHWHDGEDELLVMLSGRAVLIEDDGESEVAAGDILAWPMGSRNGHHLVNRGSEPCSFICVSVGQNTGGGYSDIDMLFTADGSYVHKDGTPY